MPDRLLVDLHSDGQAAVSSWPDGGFPEEVSRASLTWPLDPDALEDLRWYLEDYLQAPFGVWEDRGPAVAGKLARWGEEVFGSVFGSGPARDAYQRARDKGLDLVFRSAQPDLLALPWELMRDGNGPVALGRGGISRSLPLANAAGTLEVAGGRLRALMVISRPAGTKDVGYQMVARPLLERLDAVRGEVDLSVLRPPTFDELTETLAKAVARGEPFHVVHFDGHGVMLGRPGGGGAVIGGRSAMMTSSGEGVLVFEKPGGGSHQVTASKVASAVAEGRVPVVLLNACQSGAVGKDLEASVATALLNAGCAAVVAMAYSVYAVAAAEFMAAFYESLFTGASLRQAVTAGRKRLFEEDGRPSPKGDMPLADWLVPVHYVRRDVTFPQARTTRPATAPSLDAALDEIRAAPSETIVDQDPLAAVDGVFVGRDDLIYQLETAARLQGVVVLAGPGGTGKSELAKGFARWWRDTGGVDDPRLVFWHSFEPGLATFGLDGVITALGLAVFGADFALLDTSQRLSQVKRLLAQLRVLLVWDNFETVHDMPDPTGATPPLDDTSCGQLREFLGWVRDHSRSAVIITSRTPESWLGQVRRISVGGLNHQESAEYADHLLTPYPPAQAQRRHRSFGELLEWLDGHPLAMRLTLPRLEATGSTRLLAELRGLSSLSTDNDSHTDRTTSLPASITYSYSHLSMQTRRLLPAVSLFYGVTDTNLLTAFSTAEGAPDRFAGATREEWTAVLRDASRVGLLTGLRGGIYQIHPALFSYLTTVWQTESLSSYAQERTAGEQALCTASAAYSEWLTRQIQSGDAAVAYVIIGWHRQTLGAMLGHALDQHAWNDANGIVRALDAYWDTRGLSQEATALADRILTATTNPGQGTPVEEADVRSLWLYTATHEAGRREEAGQPEQAARILQHGLAWLQGQSPTRWTRENTAVLYHRLGMTAQHLGRLDEADEWYRKALTINEDLGNRPSMAMAYHQLGTTAQERRELDEADEWYRKALIINEDLGNRSSMAMTYHQLGTTAQYRGQVERARDWYRKSLTIFEDLGNRSKVAATYHQFGMTAQERGELDEADGWYRKSLTIFEDLGNRPDVAMTYHQLGITVQQRGKLDEADEWYRKALTITEDLGDRPHMAMTYGQLGLLAEDRGQPGQALEWMVRCVALFDQFPHPATGPGPKYLASLTRQLGTPALERTWQQVTGQPLPQAVRDYITSHHDDSGNRP